MANQYADENAAILADALKLLDVEKPTARDWAQLDLLYQRFMDNAEEAAEYIRENGYSDGSVVIRVDGQAVKFQTAEAMAEYIASVME